MCRGELYAVIARLSICEAEKTSRDSLPLPLLFCKSWMFVNKNADRKEKKNQETPKNSALDTQEPEKLL